MSNSNIATDPFEEQRCVLFIGNNGYGVPGNRIKMSLCDWLNLTKT